MIFRSVALSVESNGLRKNCAEKFVVSEADTGIIQGVSKLIQYAYLYQYRKKSRRDVKIFVEKDEW